MPHAQYGASSLFFSIAQKGRALPETLAQSLCLVALVTSGLTSPEHMFDDCGGDPV